jgi:hypothetical protein
VPAAIEAFVNIRTFRYLADPVCIASLTLYAINRFVLKPHHIGGWFTHGYLNDVLCLPLFVPIILRVQQLLGLRRHDAYPRAWEIFQHGIIFSVVFQLILPRFPQTFTSAGDPYDILAYLAGGLLAGAYWNIASRPKQAVAIS